MVISTKAGKKYNQADDTAAAQVTERSEGRQSMHDKDPDLSDSQKLLLEAQKNAEHAKATVSEAMTRVYRENNASRKRAENLVKTFGEAMESAIKKSKNGSSNGYIATTNIGECQSPAGQSNTVSGKTGLLQSIFNKGNNSFSVVSEVTRSLFDNEIVDAETREEFYNLLSGQSKQLRHLINSVVEDQSRKKTEKIVKQAKSEIAAAQIVVDQAQKDVQEARKQARTAREEVQKVKADADEAMNLAQKQIQNAKTELEIAHADTEEAIRLARESVKQAQEEVIAEKKAAEVSISQARQEIAGRVAEEMKAAKADVIAAKEAADTAIQRSAEIIEQSQAEIKAAQNNAQVVASLAQDKVKKATEEIEEIKQQTQITIDQVKLEAKKAEDNAKASIKENRKATAAALEESRRTKEEAEIAIKATEEARAQAEEKAFDHFREEINRISEEVETTKKNAQDIIAKANEDSRQARAEAESAKDASEQAIRHLEEELSKAKASEQEAISMKQAAIEEVSAIKKELRKTKEEAESRVLKANQIMTQASQDIISHTREEISKTREALEMANTYPETVLEKHGETCKIVTSSTRCEKVDPHYIAAMLHEIRTPLHSISGFAKLMLEDDVSDAVTRQEFLTILVQQSDTLNRLLDDLTGNLLGKSGDTKIYKTTFTLNKLIADAIQGMQNAALEKNIMLGSTIPDSLPEIEADEARIKQVLNNIIENALKFNEGDSTVIVKAKVVENELMVLVEDHGIGIPKEETAIIFDEYYRASNNGDREGQGLGLSICKKIIESHGGSIQVESVEGEGSTFGFTLPLAHV